MLAYQDKQALNLLKGKKPVNCQGCDLIGQFNQHWNPGEIGAFKCLRVSWIVMDSFQRIIFFFYEIEIFERAPKDR